MDDLLLQRARNGDSEAFEQLITPLENRIWRICWHYMGDRESASDCAQEAILRVWRGLAGYRNDCAFESWVYRIAANCCLDQLRKNRRDRSESIEPLREQGFDPADPAPGTEEQILARERKEQLRACIAQLPEEQRDALVLTQLEGVPYDRAAELLNTTAGTIKSRVNRARTKLREWMSEGLPDKHRELAAKKHVQQRERREQ